MPVLHLRTPAHLDHLRSRKHAPAASLLLCLAGLSSAQTSTAPVTAPSRNAGALELKDAAPEPRVPVRSLQVSGNSLLPAAEFAAQVEALSARLAGERSLAELRAAATELQALYRQAGYGAVLVFLPEQELKDGLVQLRVVEGRLERIDVNGQQHFSRERILAALPSLQIGSALRVREIDAQIQQLNENPARQVQVLLQPGSQAGQVAAKLSVQEEKSLQRWTARLDNSGTGHSGRWRAALGWQHADLWELDHQLALEAQTAPEQPSAVAVFSAFYRIPVPAHGLSVDAYLAHSDVDGGRNETAAGELRFNGRGQVAGLRLQRHLPRWGEVDQRLQLGLEQRRYLNDCRIAGLPEGACGPSGASVTVHPLSLSYIAQSASPVAMGLSLNLLHNLGLGGRHGDGAALQAARPGARLHYTVLRGQGQLQLPLQSGWRWQLQAAAQFSDEALVPGEQFGIGGAQSVRGYAERELNGDLGLQASVELHSPNWAGWAGLPAATDLHGLVFVDGAWVQDQNRAGGPPCRSQAGSGCSLAAVGLGLRWNWGSWQLRLDLAQALRPGTLSAQGSRRAHAFVATSF